MTKFIIIKTTFTNQDEALKMAHLLIENKLAACAQIKQITSIYSFKDKIHQDQEFELNIKSKAQNFAKITQKIQQQHSYELPQIVAIEICEISQDYGEWIEGEC